MPSPRPSAIDRLSNMGCEHYLISSALRGVLAQRLVRILCPRCRQKYTPTSGELVTLGLDPGSEEVFYTSKGCSHCQRTGYKGRTGIIELLVVNGELQKMISAGTNNAAIKRHVNIFAATGIAEAHSQPAAKVKLPAINFYDGDTLHQVTFEDMNSYYRGISGGRVAEVEVTASYRALLAAKTVLWGKSIPHRDDIIITSTLPSYASVICFKYITGTGTDQHGVQNMGEFNLVLPDGAAGAGKKYPPGTRWWNWLVAQAF